MDYFFGLLKLISFWVALVSGLLSIVREYVLLHHPEKMPQKRLFWGCVRGAFVISAAFSWYGEHRDVQQLKTTIGQQQVTIEQKQKEIDNLTMPNLIGRIAAIDIAEIDTREKDWKMDNFAGLQGRVPYVIVWALTARLKDGSELSGLFTNVPPSLRFNDGYVMPNASAASLVEKTVERPIVRGGQAAGLLIFLVNKGSHTRKEMDEDGVVYDVSFKDARDKEWHMKYTLAPVSRHGSGAGYVPGIPGMVKER